MKYWHCKCGKTESFGSDGPYRCQSCKYCGTTLGPPFDTPIPHEPVTKYDQNTGKSYKMCNRCGEKIG